MDYAIFTAVYLSGIVLDLQRVIIQHYAIIVGATIDCLVNWREPPIDTVFEILEHANVFLQSCGVTTFGLGLHNINGGRQVNRVPGQGCFPFRLAGKGLTRCDIKCVNENICAWRMPEA